MKIQYENKVSIRTDPSVAEKNKVTDTNMNEIKNVVNTNDDQLEYYKSLVDQIIPTTTGEGTDISLNTIQADMSVDIKGNTTQNTLTGKNLLNLESEITSTNGYFRTKNNGMTVGNDDLSFMTATISGNTITFNSYNQSGWNWVAKWIQLEKNTEYVLSATSSQLSGWHICGCNSKEVGTAGTKISNDLNTTTIARKFNSGDYEYYYITFYPTGAGMTIENLQIEKGGTLTTFEQYCGGIPSPNPDYPQDINVVSGDNTIVVSNKNLFDKDNTSEVIIGGINLSASAYTNLSSARSVFLDISPNTTYTISRVSGTRFMIGDTSQTTLTNGDTLNNVVNAGGTATTYTYTTSANAKKLLVFYYLSSSDTLTEQAIRDSIQIEKRKYCNKLYRTPRTNTTYIFNGKKFI